MIKGMFLLFWVVSLGLISCSHSLEDERIISYCSGKVNSTDEILKKTTEFLESKNELDCKSRIYVMSNSNSLIVKSNCDDSKISHHFKDRPDRHEALCKLFTTRYKFKGVVINEDLSIEYFLQEMNSLRHYYTFGKVIDKKKFLEKYKKRGFEIIETNGDNFPSEKIGWIYFIDEFWFVSSR